MAEVFDSVFVLYIYQHGASVGVYYHANRGACEAKQEELEAWGKPWQFAIVEYNKGSRQ